MRKHVIHTVFAKEFQTLLSAYYGPGMSGGLFKNKN